MAFAGLWEHWLGADGSEIETMAILTVAANRTVGQLHDRMPAIIAPSDFDTWLDCREGTAEGTAPLLRPRRTTRSPSSRSARASTTGATTASI
jgi:putative SOS response-associated peptidase YedK